LPTKKTKSTNFALLQGSGADYSGVRFAKGRTGVLFGAQTLAYSPAV